MRQNLSQARRFLSRLDPEATSFTFQLATDTEPEDKPNPDPLARVVKNTNLLKPFVEKNLNRAAIWVCINETDGRGRRARNIKRIRAVFADCDGQVKLDELINHNPEPHIIVESSPGHYQAYWFVNGLPVEQFEGVQRRIAETFSTDHVVDPSRVMRVPGFLHQKDLKHKFQVRIVHETDLPPYEAKRILKAFPPLESPKAKPKADGLDDGEYPELPEPLPQTTVDRYARMFPEIFEHEYESASHFEWALAKLGCKHGWSQKKVVALIRAVRDPEHEKHDRPGYLWDTVAKAYAEEEEEEDEDAPRVPVKIVPLTRMQFIRKERPPIEYYANPILSTASALIIQGKKSAGKSRFTEALVYHIEIGADFMGFKVERKGRVLYLDGEMVPQQIEKRLRSLISPRGKWKQGQAKPGKGAFFMLSWQDLRLDGINLGKLTNLKTRAIIDDIIEEYQIDIIVIDHFSKLVGGSNDVETLRQWKVIEDWITDHRGVGRSFVVLMHEGHTEGRVRGFTEIYDSFDNSVQIKPLKSQDLGYYRFRIEGMFERDSTEDADTRARIVTVPEDDLSDWGTFKYLKEDDGEELESKRGKLTVEQTKEIERLLRLGKEAYGSYTALGEKFGVSRTTISTIHKSMGE